MEVAHGEDRKSVCKVVLALGDDLVKRSSLGRNGICTSHGKESRDNKNNGLESWHVVYWKFLQVNVVCMQVAGC